MFNPKQESIQPDKLKLGSKIPSLNLQTPTIAMNPNRLSPKPGKLATILSGPKTPTIVPITQQPMIETPQISLQTSPQSTSKTKPPAPFNQQSVPNQPTTNPNRLPPRQPPELSQGTSSAQASPRHHDRYNQSMSITSINQHPTFSQNHGIINVGGSQNDQKDSKSDGERPAPVKLSPFTRTSPMPPVSATLPTSYVPLTLQALSRYCNAPSSNPEPPADLRATEGLSPRTNCARYSGLSPKGPTQTANSKYAAPAPQPTTTSLSTANTKTGSNTAQTVKITPFTDPTFPPSLSSLVSRENVKNGTYPSDLRALVWARARDLFGEGVRRVCADVTPENVVFGEFYNAPVLDALACVARWPTLVLRLFDVLEIREDGLHAVWLCWGGVWTQVILDDYLPVVDYKRSVSMVFGRSTEDDLWVCLIEKAFAKLSGSYLALTGLCPKVVMRALTGAPYEEIELNTPQSVKKAQELLQIAVVQGWPTFILSKRNGYPGKILYAEPLTQPEGILKLLVSGRVYGLDEIAAASASILISFVHGAFYNHWIEAAIPADQRLQHKSYQTQVFSISFSEDTYTYFTLDSHSNSKATTTLNLPPCRLTIFPQSGNPILIEFLINKSKPNLTTTLNSSILSLKKGNYTAVLNIYPPLTHAESSTKASSLTKIVFGTYSSSLPSLTLSHLPSSDIDRIERYIWLNTVLLNAQIPGHAVDHSQPTQSAALSPRVSPQPPNPLLTNNNNARLQTPLLPHLTKPSVCGTTVQDRLIEIRSHTGETVVVRKRVNSLAEEATLLLVVFEVIKGEFGVELTLDRSGIHRAEVVGDVEEGEYVWVRVLPKQPNCLLIKLEPDSTKTEISNNTSFMIDFNCHLFQSSSTSSREGSSRTIQIF